MISEEIIISNVDMMAKQLETVTVCFSKNRQIHKFRKLLQRRDSS